MASSRKSLAAAVAAIIAALAMVVAVAATAPQQVVFEPQQQQQPQQVHATGEYLWPNGPDALDDSTAAAAPPPLTIDSTSVKIGSRRVFIFSAEFHPWRLPVPSLWRDVLYKLKEGGMNTVSIYTHWGLISSSPDRVDLTGINDLQLFLQVAKEVGLFVNVRVGPYINAETTAGGLPAWTQTLPAALRTNDTAYHDAWKPYIDALARVIAPFQVRLNANGSDLDPEAGTVILVQLENEYFENAKTAVYVRQLKQTLIAGGVDRVPFSYNEASALNPQPSFASIVDFFGVDSYPQGFNCKTPERWNGVPTTYSEALQKLNLTNTPHAVWEFQAGSFDPYDGAGFAKCYQLTNERFARVFDHALLAQDVKVLSHYMGYGGTSWGHLAEPTVYTSYDYGAAINEHREVTKKSREYGLLGNFLRSSPAFAGARLAAHGVNLGVSNQTSDVVVSHRINEHAFQGGTAHWYIVRQNDSTSNAPVDFKLNVSVGSGRALTIPTNGTIHLDGRDSKIIPTNHVLPSTCATLVYSTAPLSYAGKLDDKTDVVVVYGDARQSFETVFEGPVKTVTYDKTTRGGDTRISIKSLVNAWSPLHSIQSLFGLGTARHRRVRINWQPQPPGGVSQAVLNMEDGRKILVLLAETEDAYLIRPLTTAQSGTLANILVDTDQDAVLVSGGYHFANTTLDGDAVHFWGQSNATSGEDVVRVFAGRPIKTATFNGVGVDVRRENGALYGESTAFTFTLPGTSSDAQSYTPPALTSWRYADSAPEINPDYDDSQWTRADKTSTHNAYFYVPGISTDGHVLFSDEYGYHQGNIVWRGHFDVEDETAVESFTIRLQGGSFFGGSVWLNGHHLGSTTGNHEHSDGNITVAALPSGSLRRGKNVLTVLHDSTGLEEWVGAKELGAGNGYGDGDYLETPEGQRYPLEGPKIPRGILSYAFGSAHGEAASRIQVNDWRVRGNYGGEECPDAVRKCLNEGGLAAEVAGWHLPGYDTSGWNASNESPSIDAPGVRYFTTQFTLNAPRDHDIPLSVVFPDEGPSATYRALLFVNGWQFGKRLAQFGPQTSYPIPPGVLDPRGQNTLGVALWSLDGAATIAGGVKLQVQGRYLGDVDYQVQGAGYAELRAQHGARST